MKEMLVFNGAVNMKDFRRIMAEWLDSGTGIRVDVYSDIKVDLLDLDIMVYVC